VEQIRQQSSFESDTLSEATLFGVIERLYRYKEVPGIREKMYDDVTRAVQRLFQIIHFFLGVEDSAIGLIVRDYFLEKPKPKQESYEELHAELQKEQSLPPQPSIKPEPTPFQTTLTIAQQMDESHPEDILAYLDEQATLLGNDQIRDLYYYDEQTGVFAWNTDVLSNGNNG